ncbi:DUF6114 domain-containing protein [Streptomyces gobiensis]|uniref:DUF6114 domain-containing protein n=1 Tax=Streptomyces gobiensis TaxID=2875706 RepID=UPI001E5C8D7D|nr:DUF6114 domain-containing protein [Streptomyces gobiensis]UGY90335.1 DUF6114 domain-containing protein [Streptomyces gobiensis]
MLLTGRGPARRGPGGWLDERLPQPELRRELRHWRRTRPFWGGLLLILAGAELIVIPLAPMKVMLSLGLGGIAAIGIGLALILAGVFLWMAPQTRHYVSLHALILSVLAFGATNLGGFLIGMLLGIAGSALGFGWTPLSEEDSEEGGEEDDEEDKPAAVEEVAEKVAEEPPSTPGGRTGHRTLAAALPVVLLAAATLPSGPGGRTARPPATDIPAASTPPVVSTTLFAPEGFTLAGVRKIPTADGPLKVMVLRMRAASLTDYRLTTRSGGPELKLGADSLALSGRVTLYLTRIRGCLEGILCLTFTPDELPVPPVIPPFVFMTDVRAEQALVTSDRIVADGLRLRATDRRTQREPS